MELERARRVRQKLDGARLRALRSARGMDAEDCAQALQLTADAVVAKELGNEPLFAAEFWRFCSACGMTVADAYRDAPVVLDVPGAREQRLQRKLLGAALAVAREDAGLGLGEGAAGAGLAEERLRLGELGEAELTLAEVEALAAEYDVEPESLFPAAPERTVPRPPAEPEAQYAFPSDLSEFLRQPGAERCVRAAVALAQLDEAGIAALEDALLFLRGG